jgi:hypothetical protein
VAEPEVAQPGVQVDAPPEYEQTAPGETTEAAAAPATGEEEA